MNDAIETVKAAAETVALNPKVATATAVVSTSLGAVSIFELANTILGTMSVCVGIIVGVMVIRVHLMKFKLMQREWDKPEGVYKKEADL